MNKNGEEKVPESKSRCLIKKKKQNNKQKVEEIASGLIEVHKQIKHKLLPIERKGTTNNYKTEQ